MVNLPKFHFKALATSAMTPKIEFLIKKCVTHSDQNFVLIPGLIRNSSFNMPVQMIVLRELILYVRVEIFANSPGTEISLNLKGIYFHDKKIIYLAFFHSIINVNPILIE